MDRPDDEIGKNRSGSVDRQAAMERHWSSGTSRSADWRRVCDMGSASADRPAVHIIRTGRFRLTIVTRVELLRTLDALRTSIFAAKCAPGRLAFPGQGRVLAGQSGIMPAEDATPIWLSALTICSVQAQSMLGT